MFSLTECVFAYSNLSFFAYKMVSSIKINSQGKEDGDSYMEILVFGAEQLCASCVQMPSAKDTAEWLQAALSRRLGEGILVKYVDIDGHLSAEEKPWAERILAGEYFYPLVVYKNQVIGEGNPKLTEIENHIKNEAI